MPSLDVASRITLALFVCGCGPELGTPNPPPEGPFTVSDYFAPSGAMGDGATRGNVAVNAAPCKARMPGARGDCYTFQYLGSEPYLVEGNSGTCSWAGLMLQFPDNNWGDEAGLPIPGAQLTTVRFLAASDQAEELVNFQIGGVGVRPEDPPPSNTCPPVLTPPGPYYDSILNTAAHEVGPEWQAISIPILPRYPSTDGSAPAPIDTLIGALGWSLNGTTTPLPKTLYIDDLVYE